MAYTTYTIVRPFINNLFWNFNGFDQGSHYSAVSTRRVLRNGIMGTLVMVSTSYLLPILIATGATDLEQSDWKEGSFATAATQIGGRWLGNWMVVAAGLSLLAQFFSEMSADSMALQGIAQRGQLPSSLTRQSSHGTPTVSTTRVFFCSSLIDLTIRVTHPVSCVTTCLSFRCHFCSVSWLFCC